MVLSHPDGRSLLPDMALKKCTECKKEMADGARTCPHCGKTYTTFGGIFIAVIIALVIGGCVFSQR